MATKTMKKTITVTQKGPAVSQAAKSTTIHPVKCIGKQQDERRTTIDFAIGGGTHDSYHVTSVRLSIGLHTEWNQEIISRFEVGQNYRLELKPLKN